MRACLIDWDTLTLLSLTFNGKATEEMTCYGYHEGAEVILCPLFSV